MGFFSFIKEAGEKLFNHKNAEADAAASIEQPLYLPNSDQPEGRFLRILEFDTARAAWTGRALRYRMEEGSTAIGDFNMIDERRALVIERDNGEGDPALACAQGQQSSAERPREADR